MPLFYATKDEQGNIVGQLISGAQPGAAGYTPVKGTDYWTEEDKSEMVAEVANIITPESIGAAETEHSHDAEDITSGTLPVTRGGTGRDTLTAGSYLVGNGTGAVAMKTKEQVKADLGITDGYSKEEVLSADTKALYGMNADGTPDEAFFILANIQGVYAFRIKVTLPDGTPVPGVALNGVLAADRTSTPITDENGVCAFAVSESATTTVSIANYIGIADKEEIIESNAGVFITQVTIVVEDRRDELYLLQTSGDYKILPGEVDLCLVGGGASGAYVQATENAGAGGGGGYAENILGLRISAESNEITLAIGAGGAATPYDGTNHAGGNSSLIVQGNTYSAAGASGQNGNGNGGNGVSVDNTGNKPSPSPGTDGKTYVFNDTSLPLPGGGGGGGHSGTNIYSSTIRTGGNGFGGNGALGIGANQNLREAATAGKGPGGGGGGGACYNGINYPAGNGASGALYIRFKGVNA